MRNSAEHEDEHKYELLRTAIRNRGNLLIAFSGGVDSSVIAKIAHAELGERAVAVTAVSETFPRREKEHAMKMASEIGIKHEITQFDELSDSEFVKNPVERCYLCRKRLFSELHRIAHEKGITTIADGANYSDLSEHRPGIRAADEQGVWHPLIEFKITKPEVRAIAKALGLSVHDRPSMACLSSRIPYGEAITREKLKMIERAECLLNELGFTQVRVRAHGEGTIARVEVGAHEIRRFLAEDIRTKVAEALKKLGFVYVALDLDGYASGSMDKVLKSPNR